MTLTQEQYDQLLSNYAESIVDGMDMDSLVQFAIEQIEENCRRKFPQDSELITEISRFYEEEDVASRIEEVGGNPADFNLSNPDDIELTEEQIIALRDSLNKKDYTD